MNDTQQSIRMARLGNEAEPIAIVEDFFPAPTALVDIAKTRPYAVEDDFYPGHRSIAPNEYIKLLHNMLNENLGELFGFKSIRSIRSSFSVVSKPPSELLALQRVPHFDVPKKDGLACIHYLCPESYGGTSFYRHNSTGYEFVDKERADFYQQRVNAEIEKNGLPEPAEYINGDTELFTRIASYDAVFNRALIYRSSSLHSGNIEKDHSFDFNPETGRLTMTSFILVDLV